MRPKYTPEFVARFLSRIDRSGGPDACHPWMGCRDGRGRGIVRTNGKNHYAYRVAWELANGPIPDGLLVCHRCDNPPCCNPRCLFLGTNADNLGDMAAKGRSTQGERNVKARLTADDVRAIRAELATGMRQQRDIAADYGVDPVTISHIAVGRTWKHVV